MKRNGQPRTKLSMAERIKKLEDQKRKLELKAQIDELRKKLKAK